MTRIVAARIDPRIVVLDLAGTIDYKSYKTTRVNQGTALKTCHVARRHSFYPITSPPSRDVWNVFDCEGRDTLEISVLERHPYTTQTFVPLSAKNSSDAFVVVVTSSDPKTGLPDLSTARAFLLHSGQAVQYDANQWHAPMLALRAMRFLVANAENATSDDLQEFGLERKLFVDLTSARL